MNQDQYCIVKANMKAIKAYFIPHTTSTMVSKDILSRSAGLH